MSAIRSGGGYECYCAFRVYGNNFRMLWGIYLMGLENNYEEEKEFVYKNGKDKKWKKNKLTAVVMK